MKEEEGVMETEEKRKSGRSPQAIAAFTGSELHIGAAKCR